MIKYEIKYTVKEDYTHSYIFTNLMQLLKLFLFKEIFANSYLSMTYWMFMQLSNVNQKKKKKGKV